MLYHRAADLRGSRIARLRPSLPPAGDELGERAMVMTINMWFDNLS